MNEWYFKLKNNLGLTLILLIGLGVEFSNFQSMFFRFMSQYRPDWGAINHIPAGFLSAFLLLCIVIFGIRRQIITSWFLAMITCVVSFAVYSRLNLVWKWEEMHEIHFVVIILSGMLPMLVAYTTHQITNDKESEFLLRETAYRKALLGQNTQSQRYYSRNHSMRAEKPKRMNQQKMNQQSRQNHQKKQHSRKPPIPPIIEDEYEDEGEYDERENEIFEDEIIWEKNINYSPDNQRVSKNLKTCENCFIEFVSPHAHAKHCSENCRLDSLQRRQSSNFYAIKDNFDNDGSMEWVNSQFK